MNANWCFLLMLLGACLVGCTDKKEEPSPTAEKPSEVESHVKRGTNGEVTVTIEKNVQQLMGLQAVTLESYELKPEIKAYGHVIDPSGLASMAGELATAQAAGEASQSELKRLQLLASQNNASERSLQAAQAAAARDQTAIQTARLHLLASWGTTIADHTDLMSFVKSLASLSSALVELTLPAGTAPAEMPIGARLFGVGQPQVEITAQPLGPAPSVSPQLQGRGFFLLVNPSPPELVPGAAVTGYLSFTGAGRRGVLLPRDAVVRFAGETWIYLVVSDAAFERRRVTLDSPLEKGWFVAAGLKAGQKAVTTGAQELLSEELKGQGGGEE